VGAPEEPIPPMKLWALITTNIHMTGWAIGSPQDINEMFAVAVKHNVRPWIQKVSYHL
jgi:alcohol dehydrogenase (NADP+)